MSTICDHHKPKAGVTGKCSVPLFSGGGPDGFCDRDAYGQQFTDLAPVMAPQYGPNNRMPYAPGLACSHHGGPSETQTRFVRDGNMWCAFRPGFENLQESIAGFGPTQAAAYDDMARLISAALANRGEAGALAKERGE